MKFAALKDICQIKHGGTPSKSNHVYWKGAIPWVSPKDMKSSLLEDATDHISDDAIQNSSASLVPSGTTLIVVRSGILTHSVPIARVARQMSFNQDIKAIIPDQNQVDAEYLYWFLRASEPTVLQRGVKKGATVHSIQSGFIENLAVPLLSLAEQRRIVDLLSRAEGIVRLRHEAQKKAGEIIQALFLDMFGDPATNPKGFVTARLAEIADVVSGITKGRKLNGKAARPVPYLRVANVQAGFLNLSEIKEIDATEPEIEALALQPGDVVLTEGGDFDKLGRGSQWRGEISPCIHQNHVFRVRLKAGVAEPDYFEAFLQTAAAKSYFLSVAKRTTNLASINRRN